MQLKAYIIAKLNIQVSEHNCSIILLHWFQLARLLPANWWVGACVGVWRISRNIAFSNYSATALIVLKIIISERNRFRTNYFKSISAFRFYAVKSSYSCKNCYHEKTRFYSILKSRILAFP